MKGGCRCGVTPCDDPGIRAWLASVEDTVGELAAVKAMAREASSWTGGVRRKVGSGKIVVIGKKVDKSPSGGGSGGASTDGVIPDGEMASDDLDDDFVRDDESLGAAISCADLCDLMRQLKEQHSAAVTEYNSWYAEYKRLERAVIRDPGDGMLAAKFLATKTTVLLASAALKVLTTRISALQALLNYYHCHCP